MEIVQKEIQGDNGDMGTEGDEERREDILVRRKRRREFEIIGEGMALVSGDTEHLCSRGQSIR